MVDVVQTAITGFSLLSVTFLALKRPVVGFGFGLLGQPFWLYATWTAHQWGMFAVSVYFTLAYALGVLSEVRDRRRERRLAEALANVSQRVQ
jgi:hypothetical protein